MPLDRRDAASLFDALEAANHIVEFTAGMSFEDFNGSLVTRRAVERELTIIGEALRRLSADAVSELPDVAVAAIIGLRNRIVHEYESVEQERFSRSSPRASPS